MNTKTIQILIILSCIVFSCNQTNTQTDKSTTKPNKKGVLFYYNELNCFTSGNRCDLDIVKLINYDTLIYVSSSEYFGSYEEFRGVLTQINDSIYYVKCFKNLTQGGGIPFNSEIKDTLSFVCDSTLINKNISIEYQNKNKEQYKIYSTFNEFKINRNYFNSNQDKIKLTFGYLHPIVDETVELIGNYGSDIVFSSNNYFNDFYIVLDSTKIKTINLASDNSSSGPRFDLKRMYIKYSLNMGRKLYGQKK